jgi:hypothetical protein
LSLLTHRRVHDVARRTPRLRDGACRLSERAESRAQELEAEQQLLAAELANARRELEEVEREAEEAAHEEQRRRKHLSEERRTGYSWESDYGVPSLRRQYEEVRTKGRDALLAQRRAAEEKARSAARRAVEARALEPKVRAALAALDAEGRWFAPAGRRSAGPWITTSAYLANARVLCDYLAAVRP